MLQSANFVTVLSNQIWFEIIRKMTIDGYVTISYKINHKLINI